MRPERTSPRTTFRAAAALVAVCCAAGAAAQLRFDHEPVAAATSGERIAITAAIAAETPGDVELARVYFKAWNEANFLFVPMADDGDGWSGTLPAPAAGVEAIEYLILAKRRPEGVYKTETFRIEVSDGDRVADYADRIDVYSELESAPETVAGFTDNIALDVVESAARYGAVAGLGGQAGSGATAASGAGAGGGTAGAGAGGAFGGIGAVGVGAGVAAAVGVGVAVTDDDDDDEDPNRPPEFGAGGTLSIEVPENTTGVIGSAGGASDPDGDALTYSLSGADSEFFVIDANGELSVAGSTDLDYEERTEYSFTVTVSDGSLSATRDVTVAVTDVEPPGQMAAPTVAVWSATFLSETGVADEGDYAGVISHYRVDLGVSWQPPLNGGPVSRYEVRYRVRTNCFDDGALVLGDWGDWVPHEFDASEAEVALQVLFDWHWGDGCTAGDYEAQVRATNDEGQGDWSVAGEDSVRRFREGSAAEVLVVFHWDDEDVALDLHVTDPCGQRIYSGNRTSLCDEFEGRWYEGEVGVTREDVVWLPAGPVGDYRVEVEYVEGSKRTTYDVLVLVNGMEREYHATLSPSSEGRQHVADFTKRGTRTDTTGFNAPTIEKVALASHPGLDGHYGAGEDIEVTLDFSDPVEVRGAPQLPLDIGATTVAADYVGASDGRSLTFRYKVVPGNRDLDGISVGIDALRLNGGAIVSANDTAAETNLGAHAIVNASEHIVDTEALDAERAVVEDALAAEGRAHLNSVTDVIGSRFRAGPGASASTGSMPGRLSGGRTSWSGTDMGGGFRGNHSPSFHGNKPWGAFASWDQLGCGAGAAGSAMDGRCQAWRNGNAGWTERALFAAGSGRGMPADFALPLSGEENESNSWTLWGAGDWQSFSGKTAQGAYDGNLRSHYLGIDGAVGERWMAGVAFSRSAGDTGYEYAAGEHAGAGALRTRLTSAYPYFRVRPREGVEAWGIGGFGSGKATLERTDRAAATSGLRLGLGAFGMKLGLADLGGMNLSWVADGGVAALRTGSSEDAVLSGLGVLVNRVRVGVEGEHAITFSESRTLHPFWRASARHDGGDGVTGRGMEVSAGMRYRSARLEAEVRGRWLATHSADDYEETGASASLRIVPGRDGLGLAASLSHRWGAPGGGADLVWERDFARTPSGGWRGRDPWSLNGDIGFGFGWPHTTVVVTPFTEVGLAGDAAVRQRLGVRLDQGGGGWQRFTSEFALLRHDAGYGDTAGAVELRAELRL